MLWETRGEVGVLEDCQPPSTKDFIRRQSQRAKVRGAFINGQGIRRKVHEIRKKLQNMDLDVMGIAETWLLPGEIIDVDGYKWIGISREGNVGRGGVGLFIRDENEVEVIETGEEEEGSDERMEVMWGRLRRKGLGDILIGVVYVTPQGLRQDPLEAILVIFGRRDLIFLFESSWKK